MLKKIFLSPFVITPLITGLMGNFSLGLILAGLTTLLWGNHSGVLFISITSSILLMLTGNINMEIIFLLVLTLTYFVREDKLLRKFDKELAYTILFFILLLLTPFLRLILGLIPASLINELNIASSLLIIVAFVLFIMRGRIILHSPLRVKDFIEYIFYFFASILALMGSFFTIPLWIFSRCFIEMYSYNLQSKLKVKVYSDKISYVFVYIFLILVSVLAAYLILPMGILSVSLILIFLAYLLRNFEKIPLVELVYLSIILGILAGRVGFLV
ncbi:hypothetical protein [Natronospora cellulosivora (SeqCode)]